MVKLNNSNNYEALGVDLFCGLATIKITKEQTPIVFKTKVEELLEEKVCETEAEAEKLINDMGFELELYYEKGTGLFAVESEAVESGPIYSPYTGELCEKDDNDV